MKSDRWKWVILVIIIIVILVIALFLFFNHNPRIATLERSVPVGGHCSNDTDCMSGLINDYGICRVPTGGYCSHNWECASNTAGCKDGICKKVKRGLDKKCSDHKDCDRGYVCQDRRCKISYDSFVPCSNDNQCEYGIKCQHHKCIGENSSSSGYNSKSYSNYTSSNKSSEKSSKSRYISSSSKCRRRRKPKKKYESSSDNIIYLSSELNNNLENYRSSIKTYIPESSYYTEKSEKNLNRDIEIPDFDTDQNYKSNSTENNIIKLSSNSIIRNSFEKIFS